MQADRILIVDDEPKLIRLVREILQATGYEALAAIRGDQAIEMAAIEQPDLIILDIMLLGSMDGYEVARRIRGLRQIILLYRGGLSIPVHSNQGSKLDLSELGKLGSGD